MGTIQLSQFRDELVFMLENRSDAALTDTHLDRWLNWAYCHISHPDVFDHREVQVRQDITLILNTFNYPISEAALGLKLLRIRQVTYLAAAAFNFTSRRVDVAYESITQHQSRTPRTGPNPNLYAIRGEELNIFPGPDSTAAGNILSLEIVRQPALLTLDTDVTVLPFMWDEILLQGALWRAQRDLGYKEIAEQTKQDFAALVNDTGGHSFLATMDTRQQAGSGIEPGRYESEVMA